MTVKRLIYLYLLLWVFEGALRKWIFPSLATPLLVVRDPVAILIIIIAYQNGFFRLNKIVLSALFLTTIAFALAISFGHGNLIIATFGARVFILHLPLIFIIGSALDYEDVIRIARFTLVLTISMSALLVLQYRSPEHAWVNLGVGGVGTAVFDGIMGKNRPPGTWSFIIGPTVFYPLSTACWFALYTTKRAPLWLLVSAGAAIIIACPVSISRGLVLGVGIVAAIGCLSVIRKGLVAPGQLLSLSLLFACILGLTFIIPDFEEARSVFMARWEVSTTDKGGIEQAIIGRVFSEYVNAFSTMGSAPIFGYGLGLGTQVGAQLGFGSRQFQLGETEWLRIFNELGPFLGLGIILVRSILTIALLSSALHAWRRDNFIPSYFFGASAMIILSGQWGQATVLGASAIGAGLLLAAMNSSDKVMDAEELH